MQDTIAQKTTNLKDINGELYRFFHPHIHSVKHSSLVFKPFGKILKKSRFKVDKKFKVTSAVVSREKKIYLDVKEYLKTIADIYTDLSDEMDKMELYALLNQTTRRFNRVIEELSNRYRANDHRYHYLELCLKDINDLDSKLHQIIYPENEKFNNDEYIFQLIKEHKNIPQKGL